MDSAWFSHLISSGDLYLRNPSALGHLGSKASYYLTHFSPGLAAYSYLSPFKSLSTSYQLGIFLGLITSSSIPLIYTILTKTLNTTTTLERVCLAAFSYFFSIFGITRFLTLDYPHFETLIPIFLTISLYFYCRKKFLYFIFFSILACSLREDAGIHGFLLYAAIGFNALLFPKYANKYTCKYAFRAAFFLASLSLAGLIFQHIINSFTTADDSAFLRIYAGEPFFGHLNFSHIADRVSSIATNWQISLPFYILLLLSIVSRNNYFVIGYVSCIPWTIMGIVAYSNVAGNFQLYYGFPYLLATIAPFAILNSFIDERKINKEVKKLLFYIVILSIPLIILFSNFKLSNGIPPSQTLINRVDEGVSAIAENNNFFREKNILVTTDVASLKPNSFSWFDLAFHQEEFINKTTSANNSNPSPIGIIYLEGGFENDLANKIQNFYSMRPENIILKHENIRLSIPAYLANSNELSKDFKKLFLAPSSISSKLNNDQ